MYGGYDGSATQFAGDGFMPTPTGATGAATGAAIESAKTDAPRTSEFFTIYAPLKSHCRIYASILITFD